MVLFRLLQGVFGAALVPLSQAVMLDSYALHERAKAMSIWGMGVMMGPIMGPSLGAWLTETYSWHWVFFVNLPFGIFTVLGLLVFMDETKKNRELRFDWFGFLALAVGIGALQIALDRGEQLGWTESGEIIAEFIVSIAGFYFFFAHSFTTSTPFIQFAIVKGFGFGLVFVPLSTVAFLTLPNHLRTDGTSMLTLMRNVASSIGISVVIAQLTEGSRRTYAILSQHVNPFNHAMQMPDVRSMIDMGTDKGRAMMDVMVNLQAQIIAFSQDYQMVMIFTLCAIPLAIMIGSTKAALRKQSLAPDHAVIE